MNYYNVIGTFISIFSGLVVSVSAKPLIKWPSLVLREGDTAEIPCLAKGQGDILTWTTGSGQIVTPITNDPDDTDHFWVGPNGTLNIYNVMLEDEGNYYCRRVSEDCDSAVGFSVLVKDQRAKLFIDQCQPHKDCVLFLDQLEGTSSVTCTALYVSPHTVLQWFRGGQELGSKNETFSGNYSSTVNISSELTDVTLPENHANLHCLAIDERVLQAGGMNAYVFIVEESDEDETRIWAFVATSVLGVLLLLTVITFVVFYLRGRKGIEQSQIEGTNEQEEEEEIVLLNQGEPSNPQSPESNKQDLQKEQQLIELQARCERLKTLYVDKFDPALLLRLRENLVKETNDTWGSYLASVWRGNVTAKVQETLEKFKGLICVHERTGKLQHGSLDAMKYLLQNSVDGSHSCIIFHFEKPDAEIIVDNLRSVCKYLYTITDNLQKKGFQIKTKMKYQKLSSTLDNDGVDIQPKNIRSKEEALDYISEKCKTISSLSLECDLSSSAATTDQVLGFLKFVVLENEQSLEMAFTKKLERRKDHKEHLRRALLVFDGDLSDAAGKQRIISLIDTINKIRGTPR